MNLSDLRQRQSQRRKKLYNNNRSYLSGTVVKNGNTLQVQVSGSIIEAENLAGGAELGDPVLIYYPQNSGLPKARTRSGTIS